MRRKIRGFEEVTLKNVGDGGRKGWYAYAVFYSPDLAALAGWLVFRRIL